MTQPDDTCRCGHTFADAHEHYRFGTQCHRCPKGACNKFRPAQSKGSRVKRILAAIGIAVLLAAMVACTKPPTHGTIYAMHYYPLRSQQVQHTVSHRQYAGQSCTTIKTGKYSSSRSCTARYTYTYSFYYTTVWYQPEWVLCFQGLNSDNKQAKTCRDVSEATYASSYVGGYYRGGW